MSQNGDEWQARPRSAEQDGDAPAVLTPEQIRERAEHLRQKDDELNAQAIGEGWGRAAFDMGVEPKDLESGARRALLHAREDIGALVGALMALEDYHDGPALFDNVLEHLPPLRAIAVRRIVEKYRMEVPTS